MAVEKRATATWKGNLTEGAGTVSPASGAFPELRVSWPRRAEEGSESTSPEELIASALGSCFSMALSHGLSESGNAPDELRVHTTVSFQAGQGITGARIEVQGRVQGIDSATFEQAAATAAENCPVSKALAGVEITHSASLAS
jgi:osmotically inducible protein OsmC